MSLTANQISLLNHSINDGVWNSLAVGVTPNPALIQFGAIQNNTLDTINTAVKALPDATVIPILTAYKTKKLAILAAQLSPLTATQTAIEALN